MLGATPAVAETAAAEAAAPSTGLFVLVACLCLFGYLMFSNYTLGARIERLEDDLRKGRGEPGELSPFSWSVLQGAYDPLPFLGNSLAVTRPGLYLVGARDPALVPTLAANIIQQLMGRDDLAVILVSQRISQDELGDMLLSLEAGVAWDSLDRAEQDRLLHRMERDLRRYEEQLWLVGDLDWSPDTLFAQVVRLQENLKGPAALLVDDPRALQNADGDGLLDRLRLVSQKASLPVFLLVPSLENGAFTRWQTVAAERFVAILEFERPADGSESLPVHFIRYPEAPPQAVFELNAATGQIVQS